MDHLSVLLKYKEGVCFHIVLIINYLHCGAYLPRRIGQYFRASQTKPERTKIVPRAPGSIVLAFIVLNYRLLTDSFASLGMTEKVSGSQKVYMYG